MADSIKSNSTIDLDFLRDLAREAGKAIMEVYATSFAVEVKDDRSPLTLADKRSHEIITRELSSRYPDIPIISEEGKGVPYSERLNWGQFWLVDPLDGTKEFVKRNGEFTVNIALVEGKLPTVGVIYIPVQDSLYIGHMNHGCWSFSRDGRETVRMHPPRAGEPLRVVKSRSHPSPNMEAVLKALPPHEVIMRGSALKFCAMARGDADFYPRLGPTWEWDTAAGQAIVSAAGGVVVDFKGEPFKYNKVDLRNGPFIVAHDADWLRAMGIFEITRCLIT